MTPFEIGLFAFTLVLLAVVIWWFKNAMSK